MRQSRAQALIAGAAIVTAAALAAAVLHSRRKQRRPQRTYDYSDRSGFPRSPEQMRGVARAKKERASGPPSFDATTRV
jgi:hypothetical protein